MDKYLGRGLLRDDPILVMKLHVLEAELDRPPMRVSLCVLAGSQAEEEGNLGEVGQALSEEAGGVGCLCSSHAEYQRDGFSCFGGGSW